MLNSIIGTPVVSVKLNLFLVATLAGPLWITFCIRLSNSLDPDRDQCSVGPDLGSNCLQWLKNPNFLWLSLV